MKGLQRMFSSSSGLSNDKVYELRTYNIGPQYSQKFLVELNKWIYVRLAHSKMVGFWMSEVGGMNDLLHLWEYDNLAHRASVRQKVGSDQTWQEDFISKILPMLSRQDNCIVKCLPGTDLIYPQAPETIDYIITKCHRNDALTKSLKNTGLWSNTGVYEIQHFDFEKFDLKNIGESIQRVERPGAELVGSFHTIVGNLSSGFLLWHHPNLKDYHLDIENLQNISDWSNLKDVADNNEKYKIWTFKNIATIGILRNEMKSSPVFQSAIVHDLYKMVPAEIDYSPWITFDYFANGLLH